MSSIWIDKEKAIEMVQRCNDLQQKNDELQAEVARLTARLARRESVEPMTADEIARLCPPRLSTVGEARGWVVGYAAGRESMRVAVNWYDIACEVCGDIDDLHRLEWADRGPYWVCDRHLDEGLSWHDEGVLLVDGQVSDHEPTKGGER